MDENILLVLDEMREAANTAKEYAETLEDEAALIQFAADKAYSQAMAEKKERLEQSGLIRSEVEEMGEELDEGLFSDIGEKLD